MSSRRRTSLLAACALALLAFAPASAGASPVWQSVGPADAGTVDFHAVATYRPSDSTQFAVIAVGQDSATHAPVIYRRLGGVWTRDELPATPAEACLTGVAVTATSAWAIGNAGTCDANAPFALRFAGGGTELLRPETESKWSYLNLAPDVPASVRSVALTQSTGYLGDAAGALHRIDDAAAADPVGAAASYPKASEVNGIALTAPDTGLAAGDSQLPTGGRIYNLASDGPQSAPFQPDPNGTVEIVDVAAAAGAPSVAIEDGAYWALENGLWTRRRPTDTFTDAGLHLRGVEVAANGTSALGAIAGSTAAGGAVWLRTGLGGWANSSGGWSKYTKLGTDLEDVAIVAGDDVWAVGADGNVQRFAELPPPPPPPVDEDDGSGTPSGGGDTVTPPDPGQASTASSNDAPPPQVTVVQQPPASSPPPPAQNKPAAGARPKSTGRLMRNVRVRVQRGRLIITFSLAAPARVGARASTAGRTLGRVGARLLGKGKRTLVLRYRGKRPPTQLQLIVRPATAAPTDRKTK